MRVRTDDEVYRVDAVWLGPPKASFPFRVRYVAWGIGIVAFLSIFTIARRLGFGLDFFTLAWTAVATVVVTKAIAKRITHERPLGSVLRMAFAELTTPRETTKTTGGAASLADLEVRGQLPPPRHAKTVHRRTRHHQARGGHQQKDQHRHGI